VTKLLVLIVVIFAAPSEGIIWDCKFYTKTSSFNLYPRVDEILYTGVVKTEETAGNVNSLTAATGTHEGRKSNVDVTAVNVTGTIYRKFPSKVNSVFPNLEAIIYDFGALTYISASDFNFPKLRFLSIYKAKLTTIDGDLFKKSPNMIGIYFTGNRIDIIGDGALDGLKQLKMVDLTFNACVDETFVIRYVKDHFQELYLKCMAPPQTCPDKSCPIFVDTEKRLAALESVAVETQSRDDPNEDIFDFFSHLFD